ncbi:helix-hairpin-helix domain-containing protein [Streptomyces sp. Ru87]|uniref:helix-hairpin-helix domain-containing protein n=1 Tax=Streptomyces sp. Ru87 TaxID=2044307 RepID=UPI000BFA7AA4|nr:helix-hairpin-helix domain-containing protein [Streptomyces sp. Ru87]PGH51181.1 hypothetical protein CRI70_07930 [Streptomyces sp. Ru87]
MTTDRLAGEAAAAPAPEDAAPGAGGDDIPTPGTGRADRPGPPPRGEAGSAPRRPGEAAGAAAVSAGDASSPAEGDAPGGDGPGGPGGDGGHDGHGGDDAHRGNSGDDGDDGRRGDDGHPGDSADSDREAAGRGGPSGGSRGDGAEPAGTEPGGKQPAGKRPGGAAAGARPGSSAAEALAAAVRAVESGERSAASFFNEPARPAAPRRTVPEPSREPGRPVPAGPGSAGPPPEVTPGARLPAAERTAQSATVREVLAAGGAPESLADAVVDTLGERAAQAVREDPWQLLSVPGVLPEQADGFARALLGPEAGPGDERRTTALTGWLLERAALHGHTALEPSALTAALAQQSVPDPEEALHAAIADGGVLVFQDALETPGAPRPAVPAADGGEDGEEEERPVRVLIGLDRYALAEESLADGLARVLNAAAPDGFPDAADWRAQAEAAPSPSAAELIRAVAAGSLVAHTGGEAARAEPAAVVRAAGALGLRACAATHTRDGARRIAALLARGGEADAASAQPASGGVPPEGSAVTVGGLLSGREGPGRDAEGALALDVLVVLDAPQLDVETAAALVESLPDGVRLVLSGDPGVLDPAGPGRVFADLLAARICPRVASRTPDPGPVGELVSGIGIGELNQVEAPDKEIVIVPVGDPAEAVHRTVQLVADSVPRAIGVPPEQTQVITPGHGGAAGTRTLNAALKERLNPGPGRFGGFDPGDRVVYVPAPGRAVPGTVVSADAEGLRLDCGEPVLVPRDRVGDAVRHGWAVTAHQAVGTRWPAVVAVLPGDAVPALTRDWVYTAFGRADRHLSVVQGAGDALPRAVAEGLPRERTTRLRTLLGALTPPAA